MRPGDVERRCLLFKRRVHIKIDVANATGAAKQAASGRVLAGDPLPEKAGLEAYSASLLQLSGLPSR